MFTFNLHIFGLHLIEPTLRFDSLIFHLLRRLLIITFIVSSWKHVSEAVVAGRSESVILFPIVYLSSVVTST